MKPLGRLATLLVTMACALPAIAQSDETAKRFHVFPQLADGGGWQSVLLVTNAAQSSSFCTFALHGLSLDRFSEVSGITVSGSTATFEIPGPSGYRVWRTKNESALASGYATLDCTAPVVAQVLYASRDGSGVTGMATVFSSQAGGVFQFPVLTPEASLGIAIANDTNTEASCRFVLESPERQNLGQATLPVASKSNVAKFLFEVIPVPDGFTEGSATVSCDQQVAVIGLQFAGAIFTTLPPAVLSTTPVDAGTFPPDPPGIDNLLTPGSAVAFSLGPVDSSTLFNGDNSFQLEVPDGAARVTVTLESSDDMGLYVRYGEDNRVQSGSVVSDYSSDKVFAGTEEIIITGGSDPPLRAGTYFISVVLFDTGVEAEGTLMATVELAGAIPPPPPMSSTCAAGLVVQIGGSCDVVVGGSTVGTFSVSSTSGCLRIGGINLCSGEDHNIQGARFNQYLITFVTNRRQDGSWEITSYSISS